MLRSVYSISRFLPAYSLFNKNGFNYCFEYRLFLSPKNQNKFPNVHTSKIKIANCDLSNISINVEYMNKREVFQLEEEYHKKTLEFLISNRSRQRPRCFSLTNPSNNSLFEVLTFDSNEQMIKDEYFSDKRKAKNKLNISNAPSQIKYVNDISFQSETDNIFYHHYINTTPSDIEVNLMNDLCVRKCSIISDLIDHNPNQNCNSKNTESNAKKLMKTSDTSSEFESENSFELEIDDEGIDDKTQKNIVNTTSIGERPLISANSNTEDVLNCYNIMKKLLRTKTRLNTYKLCEIYKTVLGTKY